MRRRVMLFTVLAGLLVQAGLTGLVFLGDLRRHTLPFLALYGLAWIGYSMAVLWLLRRPGRPRGLLPLVLGLAVVFRVTLLLSMPPTLSDDVYRYIWDGRIANAGVSPYAHIVESPLLDAFDSPQRAMVNHPWMASPYLPVAQLFFVAVYRLAPDSPLAFQVAAVLLDLLAGGLVLDLLRRLNLPPTRVLIYLWNPLVLVEFAHGAHVEALMIALIGAALWLLVAARSRFFSALALAAATLTKGVPALLVPVVARRWRWPALLFFVVWVVAACLPFALGAGWGLTGPTDGVGLFGALRIYASYWDYNGSLYRLLEIALSGHWTGGVIQPDEAGWGAILAAKLIVATLMGAVLVAVWFLSRRWQDDLSLLRLSIVPLATYLLLATTVHPWYVTVIVPLLPFLLPPKGEARGIARLLLPGLYLSAVVALSYLTYLDPANPRETVVAPLLEYVPLYLLLIGLAWSAWDSG